MNYSDVILIMDMDGTLLASSGEKAYLSEENKQYIETFIAKGGTFSVASGRNMQNVFQALNGLKVNFPYTLMNGALSCHHETKAVLFEQPVSRSFVKKAYRYYQQSGRVVMIVADELTMYGLRNKDVKISSHGFKWTWIKDHQLQGIKPLKLAFAVDPEMGKDVLDDLNGLNQDCQVELLPSSPYFIEMVDRGVSKGQGILKMIERFGLQNKTLICVGDYLNDLSMLTLADKAYVIQNGHPLLKEQFSVLSSTHNECMMAEMLKIIDDLE